MTKIEQVRVPKAATTKQRKAATPSTPLKGTQTFVQEPITVHSAETELDSAYSDYTRSQTRLLNAIGFSWKRMAAAFITSFCVGCGIGWLAGIAIEAIAMAAFALTGSATAMVVIWVLGALLAIALGSRIGAYVGMTVYDGSAQRYVATKYVAAKNFVGAIFDRKDIELGGQHA